MIYIIEHRPIAWEGAGEKLKHSPRHSMGLDPPPGSVVECEAASQQHKLSYRPGRPTCSQSFGHRPHLTYVSQTWPTHLAPQRQSYLVVSHLGDVRACDVLRCDVRLRVREKLGEREGEGGGGGRPRHHVRPQHGHEWQRLQDDWDQEGQCYSHCISNTFLLLGVS